LPEGSVIEIASGSGQHVEHFAKALPKLTWQPTEYHGSPNPLSPPQDVVAILGSIKAYAEDLDNIGEPVFLDASKLIDFRISTEAPVVAILAVNVVHISPVIVLQGILQGSSEILQKGGKLFMYGPFMKDGVITPDSNVKFDAKLKTLNPEFGLRDLTEIKTVGLASGLEIVDQVFHEESNNYTIVLSKL